MKFLESRKQIVFGIACLALVFAVLYGAFNRQNSTGDASYEGLTLWDNIEMSDELRVLLEQRIALTQAAIEAQLAAEGKTDIDLYTAVYLDARRLGDFVTAREAVEAYLEQNPLDHTMWNNYGSTLEKMGDYVRAEGAYRQAYFLTPREEFLRDLVVLIEEQFEGRDQEAKELLEQGVEDLGQTPWLMVMLGNWYALHYDCDRAIDHYEIAETLSPGNEGIEQGLASLRTSCTLE